MGSSIDNPLPEAIEFIHYIADTIIKLHVCMDLFFRPATEETFMQSIQSRSGIIMFIGHGDKKGNLLFNDKLFNKTNLKELKRKGCTIQPHTCFIFFSCFGSVFAKALPCPWIAFDKEVRREAPRGYMLQCIKSWQDSGSFAAGKDAVWKKLDDSVVKELKPIYRESRGKFPELRLQEGEPEIVMCSAKMAGTFHYDFYKPIDTILGTTLELAILSFFYKIILL